MSLVDPKMDTHNLQFKIRLDLRSALGLGFILYALLIYELLGYAAGHGLMKGPLFGVAPCPTTIFTIGMLLLEQGTLVVWLAIIPIVWSLNRIVRPDLRATPSLCSFAQRHPQHRRGETPCAFLQR